jgi:hypothetical protein
MRFTSKMKLNTILKIAYKSCIILLIALTIGLDLGKYVVSVQDQQWIIDWNGTVSIYGNHIGLLISNYLLSFSTLVNLFTILFLGLAIVHHAREGRTKVQNYPVGLFILIAQLFSMITFLTINLPASNHPESIPWPSTIISKVLVPILVFIYVMVLMENKSWYGIAETILRYGVWMFVIFIGIVFFYWLLWLSKYVDDNTANLFTFKNGAALRDGLLRYGLDADSVNELLDNITENWNNHNVLNDNLLFHFSNETSIIGHFPEWVGTFIGGAIFLALSVGLTPLLALLNISVVSSSRYMVNKETGESINQVIDLRSDVDTIDFSDIKTKK